MPELIDSYSADQLMVHGHEALADSTSAGSPFFCPLKSDNSDLCYIVLSILRWRTNFNLIQGQVVRCMTPLTGWLNPELELVLHIVVAKLHTLSRVDELLGHDLEPWMRYNVALSGAGNSALHGEAAAYYFRPDSIIGFLGNQVRMHSLDKSDIADLVKADGYSGRRNFMRRPDGHLPIHPKFYVRCSGSDGAGQQMFDVETRSWIHVRELKPTSSPMFLPFERKDENFTLQRRSLERRIGGRFVHGDAIYVGTNTMTPALVGKDIAERKRQLQETLHDSTEGYAWQCEQGIRPGFFRIPRLAGTSENRHAHLRQVLNANGQHLWRTQWSDFRG